MISTSRWIEKWLRRWRGVYCGHRAQINPAGISILSGLCQQAVRDLRSAQCAGSKRKSVLQSLQDDLECDAFNSAPGGQSWKLHWMFTWLTGLLFIRFFSQC